MNMVRYKDNVAALYQTLAGRALSLGALLWEVGRNGVVLHTPAEPQALADWATSTGVWQRLYGLVADRRNERPEGLEIWPGARAWLLSDRPNGTAARRFVAVALMPGFEAALETMGVTEQHPAIAAAISSLTEKASSAMPHIHSVLRWTLDDLIQKGQLEQTVEQFSHKLAQSYEEVNLLFRLARLMNSVTEPLQVLHVFCGQLQQILPFGWVGIRFHSQNTKLKDLAGQFFCAGQPPVDQDCLMQATDKMLAQWKRDELTAILTPQRHVLAQAVGAEVIAEPITHDNLVVGTLLAGNKHGDGEDISSDELQFMDAAADFLGVYHENMSRFNEQQAMLIGTLHALTAAIDAKDPYTCGHSERVSLLSGQMAAAMGLSAAEIEEYRIAGLVHDVGKIGVPEEVLCKAGRLTEAEFAQIKLHPETGHRIIKGISLLGSALPGVLHHHERWDGRGYPHGLASEQIPLVARVVALADTFDAMSSNRSYRAGMPRERVVAEMRQCAGSQFDPAMVETFLGLGFSEFDQLLDATVAKAAA